MDTGDPTWAGPDVSLRDCDGASRTFAELAGAGGLVVAVGAAWCGPCQDDAPALQAFAEAHPDIGVAQVLVEDERAAPATTLTCAAWVEAFALTHPVLIDPAYVTAPLGEGAFPFHVVYRADGALVAADGSAFDAEATLAALR